MILAALAIADNWFLITLALSLVKNSTIKSNIFEKSNITCKIVIFSSFTSSFLSVW